MTWPIVALIIYLLSMIVCMADFTRHLMWAPASFRMEFLTSSFWTSLFVILCPCINTAAALLILWCWRDQ